MTPDTDTLMARISELESERDYWRSAARAEAPSSMTPAMSDTPDIELPMAEYWKTRTEAAEAALAERTDERDRLRKALEKAAKELDQAGQSLAEHGEEILGTGFVVCAREARAALQETDHG